MVAFIYICILVLNVVAILLTYHSLGTGIDQKEKAIFIIIGVAVMYMAVTFAYWIGTKNIAIDSNNDLGKNLIIFTFVPVNSIVILPFLANSYRHWKAGVLKPDKFRNRIILLAVIFIILFIIEIFYFKDIQTGIVNMLNAKKQ
ncbi:MAG: hypothetical protein IJ777_03820 [Clostridia bacterium]|nr:hypothetical protein [Clostridia bacterium]